MPSSPITALSAGAAVLCQKPLGRSEAEARAVVEAAQAADRPLAVDLSYRFTEGMAAISRAVRAGELGRVQAVDLVFHNAYGPDKAWFYDRRSRAAAASWTSASTWWTWRSGRSTSPR
jgi:predicted dehydrogenase